MLARMGATFDLEPQAPCSREIRILKDLHVAQPKADQGSHPIAQPRPDPRDISVLKRQTKVLLTLVEPQSAELDTEIATLIEAQQSTARSCDILRFLPGVGAVTAAAMLAMMPEIGTLDRKQVASLAGLAPITRQSGQWQAKAFIGSGRKPLRAALHLPAWVAMRCNPDLKAKYTHLRTAGKPAKAAIVACIGKTVSQTVF